MQGSINKFLSEIAPYEEVYDWKSVVEACDVFLGKHPEAGAVYVKKAYAAEQIVLERFRKDNVGGKSSSCNEYCKGLLGGAVKDLTKALRIMGKRPEIYAARSSVYWTSGELRQALGDINQALAIDPNSVGYLFQKARFKYYLGDYDWSVYVGKVLGNPNCSSYYYMAISELYLDQKNITVAADTLDKGFKKFPKDLRLKGARDSLCEKYESDICDPLYFFGLEGNSPMAVE